MSAERLVYCRTMRDELDDLRRSIRAFERLGAELETVPSAYKRLTRKLDELEAEIAEVEA